jgi:hypothetical protein
MSKDHNIEKFDPNGCMFLEAQTGDGGNHAGNPSWYLSQDISLDAGSAWPAQGTNHTSVRAHWSGGIEGAPCKGLTFPFPDRAMLFDLFITDPTLVFKVGVFTPGGSGLHPLGQGVTSTSTEGGAAVFTSTPDWQTSDAGTTTSHFCMVARCYPEGVNPCDGILGCGPDPAGLGLNPFMIDDPHYAQLNLALVPAGQVKAQVKFPIKTGNNSTEAEEATITATADLQPTQAVLDVILPVLTANPAYKKIATTPLQTIGFDMSNFGKRKGILGAIADLADKGEDEVEEIFTGHEEDDAITPVAKLKIGPGVHGSFDLDADLSTAAPGDAHVYHVRQTDATGKNVGGLCVIFLRT